jgi:hypothetical protein
MHRLLFVFALSLFLTPPAFAASLTAQVLPLESTASIPQGAQRVPMQMLKLKASCDASLTIESFVLAHEGRGPVSDLSRVYAWTNKRISRAVVPRAAENFTLRLQPPLTIAACKTVDLALVADYSADATIGSEHRIMLVSIETTDDAEVTIQKSSSNARRTTPSTQAGTVTVEFRNVNTPMKYGANRVLARLYLSAEGPRDQQVRAITLTNNGSASNTDLQNFYYATTTGETLSKKVVQMDGDTIRISFDKPLVLRSGNSRLIELRGDIRSGARKTIRWSMEEPSDIEATEVRGR